MLIGKTWAQAKKLEVIRGNWMQPPSPLEPGVKYFVLAIEAMGGRTEFSCEGHPDGFYILFTHLRPEIVAAIASVGYFTIAITRHNTYRLSLLGHEHASFRGAPAWTEKYKASILRSAAKAWELNLAAASPPVNVVEEPAAVVFDVDPDYHVGGIVPVGEGKEPT